MLVVDDEPGVLRFTRISLSVAGYDVVTTTSGEEALKLMDSVEPDIVILDLVMVPLTGFDVLTKLREFSQVPVIITTARNDMGAQALKEGANGFIAKPFNSVQLIKVIEDTVDGHEASA